MKNKSGRSNITLFKATLINASRYWYKVDKYQESRPENLKPDPQKAGQWFLWGLKIIEKKYDSVLNKQLKNKSFIQTLQYRKHEFKIFRVGVQLSVEYFSST